MLLANLGEGCGSVWKWVCPMVQGMVMLAWMAWAQEPPPTAGIDALLRMAPPNAHGVVAMDFRHKGSLASYKPLIMDASRGIPPLRAMLESLPLDDIFSWATPAGVICVAGDQRHPEFMGALVVSSTDRATAGLKALFEKNGVTLQESTMDGLTVWSTTSETRPLHVAVHRNFVYFANTQDGIRAWLKPAESSMALSNVRSRFNNQQGLFGYISLRDFKTDAAEYVVVQVEDDQSRVYVKLNPKGDSPVVKALLTPPRADMALARYFPSEWNNLVQVDAAWMAAVVQSVRRRARVAGEWEQEVLNAISGPCALGGDFLDTLPGFIDATQAVTQHQICTRTRAQVKKAVADYRKSHKNQPPASLKQLRLDLRCTTGTAYVYQKGAVTCRIHASPPPDPAKAAPTALLAVRLQSPTSAEPLIQAFEKRFGAFTQVPGGRQKVLEGIPVMFTIVSDPQPLLLVAAGPHARARLQAAQSMAPGSSMADDAEYRAIGDQGVAAAVFMNVAPLVKTLIKSKAMLDMPAGMKSLLDYPKLTGSMSIHVEPDGVAFIQRVPAAIAMTSMAGFVSGFVYSFRGAREDGRVEMCQSNLKNVGTALEMYSTDNAGRYPPSVQPLMPEYLKAMPTWPAADRDTYSESYQYATNPDSFTIFCQGDYHRPSRVKPNYPQYTSVQGLIKN